MNILIFAGTLLTILRFAMKLHEAYPLTLSQKVFFSPYDLISYNIKSWRMNSSLKNYLYNLRNVTK